MAATFVWVLTWTVCFNAECGTYTRPVPGNSLEACTSMLNAMDKAAAAMAAGKVKKATCENTLPSE